MPDCVTIRRPYRTKPRPAADYETVQMSISMMHHIMAIAYEGFLRGNGATHVTRCSCESCKFRRQIRSGKIVLPAY